MANIEEMNILKSKVKDLESKFSRVAAFVTANAELIAEQKQFLDKSQMLLQTFMSGLKEGRREGGAGEISVITKPSTSGQHLGTTIESLPASASTSAAIQPASAILNEGSPSKVNRTKTTPPLESIIDVSPIKPRFPRRTTTKPTRYGANLYNKYDNVNSTDDSEEEPTGSPLLAPGLIPKPVYEESFFDSSNDSLEFKVEEMEVEMPILEAMEGNNRKGGDMPTFVTVSDSGGPENRDADDNPHDERSIISKKAVQSIRKRNMQDGDSTRGLNTKLAAANRFVKMRKSSRQKKSVSKGRKQKALHICDQCGKQLRSRHGLMYHIQSHSGTKPYQCSRCEVRFSRKTSINRHMLLHTGEKNFICPACDKAFFTKSELFTHSRVHSRKGQECPTCSKIFFDPRYFKGHVKACSSAEVNKCLKCGKVLKDPNYFRRHVLLCQSQSLPAALTVG